MSKTKALVLANSPVLACLAVGWLLILPYFGKNHNDYVNNVNNFGRAKFDSALYAALFMHFWIFSIGVPATIVLVDCHELSGNEIIGILSRVGAVVCAATGGATLPVSVMSIYLKLNENVAVMALVGGLLSVFSLVALIGFMPYIVKNINTNRDSYSALQGSA